MNPTYCRYFTVVLLSIALWMGLPAQSVAQFQIGAGIAASRHTSGYLRNYRAGAGLDLRLRYIIKDKFAIGLNTGLFAHGNKLNNKNFYYRYSYVPFMLAGDYVFPIVDKLKGYAGLELGAMIFSSIYYDKRSTTRSSTSSTNLGLGIELGLQYDISDALYFYANLGARSAYYNNYWGRGRGSLGLAHFAVGLGVNI